jgi:hypothetical protein
MVLDMVLGMAPSSFGRVPGSIYLRMHYEGYPLKAGQLGVGHVI